MLKDKDKDKSSLLISRGPWYVDPNPSIGGRLKTMHPNAVCFIWFLWLRPSSEDISSVSWLIMISDPEGMRTVKKKTESLRKREKIF